MKFLKFKFKKELKLGIDIIVFKIKKVHCIIYIFRNR